MSNDILDKLKDIVSRELEIKAEDITLESNLTDDLGADSLEVAQLVMNLEDEFGIEIPDEEVSDIKTVQDLVKYLENKTDNKE